MKVRVVAPSGKLDKEKFDSGLLILKNHGFECVPGEYLFSGDNYFSAPDDLRSEDLQNALDGPEDVIWIARGGYGLGRIIDGLNWEGFIAKPKVLIGYSDITLLLNELVNRGFEAIHGPMIQSMEQLNERSIGLVKEILDGTYELSWDDPMNRSEARIKGSVIGGNLSLLANSIGTPSEPGWDSSILFLEEVNEPFHKVDRMLNQLQRIGIFERISGLITGEFSGLEISNGEFDSMIRDKTGDELPFAQEFPAGHGVQNLPLPFGRELYFQFGKTCKLEGIL